MTFDVITAFPAMVEGPLGFSILKRAREAGIVTVRVHDLRGFTEDKHHKVDDAPFGGGDGMVFMPGPLFAAVEGIRRTYPVERGRDRVVLFCPQGARYDQDTARRLAGYDRLILICGRYKGVDERVREHLADEAISIGDYILTGGEIPALAVIDSVTRLRPGALGDEEAPQKDSFWDGTLDHPHYTRPADFRGHRVPEVLLSGDHEKIAAWRREQARKRTAERRPDLLERRREDDEATKH